MALRKIRAPEIRCSPDCGQQIAGQAEMEHLLHGDTDDRSTPTIDELRLRLRYPRLTG